MSDVTNQFQRRLAKRIRQERAWSTVLSSLRLLPVLLVGTALLLLLDLLLALPTTPRAVLGLSFLLGLVLRFGGVFWRALRSRPQDVARAADDAAGDRRRSILSAWELQHGGIADDSDGLSAALARRAAERGSQRLANAPPVRTHRASLLRQATGRALLAAILVGIGLWAGRSATPTLVGRLLTPWRDIPPWSRLHFRVAPDPAEVPFGGELALAVSITGDTVRAPVEILTRLHGNVQSSTCFAEGEGRYAIRLENVVEPIEFCFRTGRSRTTWHQVQLRMQPRILGATIAVQPPTYSGLDARQFALGTAPVRALKGSLLTLRLICNRAVPSGALRITHATTGDVSTVRGEPAADGGMRFQWRLLDDGFGTATVTSADGLSCRLPVEFRQQVVPDRPPRAAIREPGLFALATPTGQIPFEAMAEDDLGLDRIALVRAVAGFRDRSQSIPVRRGERDRQFSLEFSLADLGVSPGETLEFYVEAHDCNPELTGIGTSDIARVQIISEDEYAKLLRARVVAEDLARRYEKAADAMKQVLATAEALREAIKEGKDKAALEALHAQLAEQTKAAREHFERLSSEAVAYDVEKELRDALKDRVGDLKVLEHWLGKMGAQDERLAGALDEMIERMRPGTEDLAGKAEQAAAAGKVAAVMRRASEYQRLLQRQRFLVRQLRRTANADRSLAALATEQDRIHQDLDDFRQRLLAAAADLPPEFEELKTSTEAFAAGLEDRRICELMAAATAAARQPDVVTARKEASAALVAMEAMLSKPCDGSDGFAGLCQGQLRFKVPDPLAATCSQIMNCLGLGTGTGTGQGVGGGSGDPNDGFRAGASGTGRDVPVFGKPRSQAGPAVGPASAAGAGTEGGKGRSKRDGHAPPSHEPRGTEPKERETSRTLAPTGVHPRYRDALRRYYEAN